MKIPNRKLQKKVYNAVKTFIEENGYSPSYSQLQELTGISRGYISTIINVLVKLGYLERPRDRIIKLTGEVFK